MIKQKGQTMIASMIVIAIILILAVILLRGYTGGHLGGASPRQDKLGHTIPGLATLSAKDDVCRNNLSQDRSAIQIAHTANGDEGYPATLDDLKLGHDFTIARSATNATITTPQPAKSIALIPATKNTNA